MNRAINRWMPEQSAWALPILYIVLGDLRRLTRPAQTLLEQRQLALHDTSELLQNYGQDTGRVIHKALTYCLHDRTPNTPIKQTKKMGLYRIASVLYSTYHQLGLHNNYKSLMRLMDSTKDLPPFKIYPKAHRVAYKYEVGLLAFIQEEYAKAIECLLYAFELCHKNHASNRERILTYLIPCRMIQGTLPHDALLAHYPRIQTLYQPLVASIRNGDVGTFARHLQQHEHVFLKDGTFVALETCKLICMRTLCRQVWTILNQSSRISFQAFEVAFRQCRLRDVMLDTGDVDADAVECMLANLIYKGYMRGYLSHEHKMAVLSKVDAFPKLVIV